MFGNFGTMIRCLTYAKSEKDINTPGIVPLSARTVVILFVQTTEIIRRALCTYIRYECIANILLIELDTEIHFKTASFISII